MGKILNDSERHMVELSRLKAKHPANWKAKGDSLLKAAILIKNNHLMHLFDPDPALRPKAEDGSAQTAYEMYGVFSFLCGLVLENYLKGIILFAEHEKYIVDGKLASITINGKKRSIKSHNLILLTEMANIALTPREANTLKGLTNYVVWMGRYPIKDDASLMTTGGSALMDHFAKDALALIESLSLRLEAAISTQPDALKEIKEYHLKRHKLK